MAASLPGVGRQFSPEQRRSDELTWRAVELVLEGAVFLVMGLELKQIVTDNFAKHNGLGTGIGIVALAFAVIMVTRAAYVSLLVWLPSRRATRKQRSKARLESFHDRLDQIADGTVPFPRGGPGPCSARSDAWTMSCGWRRHPRFTIPS